MAAARYVIMCYTRTACVIPRLRVVLFVESRFIVNFSFQGQCYALKVNEFQVWHLDRRRRRLPIKTSCYEDFERMKSFESVGAKYNAVVYIFKVHVKVGCCCSFCNRAKQSRIIRCNTSFKGQFIRRLQFY